MKITWPPAWLLVLLGLLLNVLAIILSSQVLDELSQSNNALQDRQNAHLRLIQQAWNKVENIERKKELLLLVLAGRDRSDLDAEQARLAELNKQITVWLGKPIPELSLANLSTLSSMLDQAQTQQRNRIDKHYLDNLHLMEQMSLNDHKIARYKNIALFLQIFGLALILARDLQRNREFE
ncbi:hypothetical protein [Vibrio ezurae]|uniref:DNA mismatch repair protein n=1 Tax=Vibrio ezurae NBRC 102218 TaxID=1219080 RepID=U3CNH7_9VIBR|nr:hypothetical protein [Vibrio ezurae]GAD79663.1 hypothetical protein VEZ01S_19_00780 [Vibrio ezurae NBRC 102218]